MQNVWTTRTVYTTRNNLKVIKCARERCDNETCDRMQEVLNSQGEQASVELHKRCYCSFTSKYHVSKPVAKKMKDDSIDKIKIVY